jgi:hypothetical protein
LPKLTVVLGWLLTLAIAIGIAHIITGYPMQGSYDHGLTAGLVPDVLHERATGWEAIYGNPYRPVGEVMVDHGYPTMSGGLSVRTPAAFLLQAPLAHVPDSILLLLTVSGVLISLVICLALSIKMSHIDPRMIWWLGPAFFLSFPAVTAVGFGSLMVLIPVTLVLVGWTFRDRDWSGVAIGLAASSRLWPALIIVGLWLTGRRKAALIAVATFLVATALGLALPGVTVGGTIEALSTGGSYWITNPQNVSLAHLFDATGISPVVALVVAVLAGLGLALWYRHQALALTVITALIASPLSWPAYTIVALPAMMGRIGRSRPILLATIAFPWVGWVLVPSAWRGYAFFGSLVLLLILVAMSPIEHEHKLDGVGNIRYSDAISEDRALIG